MLDIQRVIDKDKGYIKECIEHYINIFISNSKLIYNKEDREYTSTVEFGTDYSHHGDVILYNSIYTVLDICRGNYDYTLEEILSIMSVNMDLWNEIRDNDKDLWRLQDRISEIIEFVE